jgi:hypothetical protein
MLITLGFRTMYVLLSLVESFVDVCTRELQLMTVVDVNSFTSYVVQNPIYISLSIRYTYA